MKPTTRYRMTILPDNWGSGPLIEDWVTDNWKMHWLDRRIKTVYGNVIGTKSGDPYAFGYKTHE